MPRRMKTAEIAHLLKLELLLDLRQRHAWGSMLLYVVSAIYVCHLAVRGELAVNTWNALFWIILVFAAFNALARSFQREDLGRQLYLFTLAGPQSVVVARTLYNAITMVLGSIGFAAVLTLISAIAARAGNGLGLMAILGFPLVLPMLLAVMRASKLALDGIGMAANGKYFVMLLAIDALTVAVSYLLFPYLWRD